MANEEVKERNLENVYQITHELFLEHGLEKVTKEMISKKSGLSRRTIDRYFADKTDCVIQVIEWSLRNIRMDVGSHFPDEAFTDGKHTGSELLKLYMNDMKDLFFSDHRLFVLYSELKIYVYRNCESYEQGYTLLCNWMGNRKLREKIYSLGKSDGSMPCDLDIDVEEEYFSESFFGFLANLAPSFPQHNAEELERQIDLRIQNTIAIYEQGAYFQH
jgi:AcrR family transcriptional regulator